MLRDSMSLLVSAASGSLSCSSVGDGVERVEFGGVSIFVRGLVIVKTTGVTTLSKCDALTVGVQAVLLTVVVVSLIKEFQFACLFMNK